MPRMLQCLALLDITAIAFWKTLLQNGKSAFSTSLRLPLEKLPLLSVVLVLMTGAGKGTASVDGGVTIVITLLPEIAVVVPLLTRVPERVALSPTLIDSGVNVAESIVACFSVGCCKRNVDVAVTLSLARAVMV